LISIVIVLSEGEGIILSEKYMSSIVIVPGPINGISATEIVLPGVAKPDDLLIQYRSLEEPTARHVIVKMEASGVSFAERAMMRDKYPGMPKFPFVPGYDLVGMVVAVGPNGNSSLIGQRVAALTKTGGWASYALLAEEDLLLVPGNVDPAEVEALVVNGITAYQMLHHKANIKEGQTILVHGANGGVGSVLTQLALHNGVKVIGAASPRHHAALKAKGVIPIDYNDINFSESVRKIAPAGVDAVFDNIGGDSIARSFGLLKPGGTLVSSAIAFALESSKSVVMLFLVLMVKLFWLNILPNKRKAVFYNIWTGKGSGKFRAQMKADFSELMLLLRKGVLKPEIAAKFPLEKIRDAMELAESRTTYGKVIIIP
jgi:NADPH:quinone reductase-like Zn-dependent oxidoreductase